MVRHTRMVRRTRMVRHTSIVRRTRMIRHTHIVRHTRMVRRTQPNTQEFGFDTNVYQFISDDMNQLGSSRVRRITHHNEPFLRHHWYRDSNREMIDVENILKNLKLHLDVRLYRIQ